MHLLIVSATVAEIQPLIDYLNKYPFTNTDARKIFQIRDSTCNVIITGAGMAQTAYHLGSHLTAHKYDLSIQAGICGAFKREIEIGEVVQVQSEEFAQTGAEDGDNFLDLFQLNLADKNQHPFTDGKLVCPDQFNFHCISGLKSVHAVTVDTVHGNESSIKQTINVYHPAIESMEGASFFYACIMQKIPFIQLRAISNYVEKRNKANWNIPLAVGQLNHKLIELIEEITA